MADQLHLINAYKDEFKLIDKIYIKLKFSNDLQRDEYTIMTSRLNMESKLNKTLKKSKLLTYFAEIGILDSPRKLMGDALFKLKGGKRVINPPKSKKFQDSLYLNNFIRLVALYGYDKNKTTLLMDKSETSILFLDYLDQHGYDYIDFGNRLNNADKKTTLVYDKHWNDYGRKLISEIVVSDLRKTLKH